jgi:hypothetical protein
MEGGREGERVCVFVCFCCACVCVCVCVCVLTFACVARVSRDFTHTALSGRGTT